MIFMTKNRDERPICYGYVNGIVERQLPSGATIRTYMIGTREKKLDGTYVYSSWPCTLIGNARKECENNPIAKGSKINIYGLKQTNVSKRLEDGTYTKSFLNMAISEYEIPESQTQQQEQNSDSFYYESDDEMPF